MVTFIHVLGCFFFYVATLLKFDAFCPHFHIDFMFLFLLEL